MVKRQNLITYLRPSFSVISYNLVEKSVFLQIISGICSRTPIDCGHQVSKGREVEFYLDVVEELLARGEAGKKKRKKNCVVAKREKKRMEKNKNSFHIWRTSLG